MYITKINKFLLEHYCEAHNELIDIYGEDQIDYTIKVDDFTLSQLQDVKYLEERILHNEENYKKKFPRPKFAYNIGKDFYKGNFYFKIEKTVFWNDEEHHKYKKQSYNLYFYYYDIMNKFEQVMGFPINTKTNKVRVSNGCLDYINTCEKAIEKSRVAYPHTCTWITTADELKEVVKKYFGLNVEMY